jgi:hypothetical protein
MGGGMFHLDDEGGLSELTEKPYDSEDLLQSLLEQHPELLAGNQISSESPRRWLHISREMGIPDKDDGTNRWSADHVFIDQDAIPTIVEVKQSKNTQIRREIVGQILDYAANAMAYWPAERMREAFEANNHGHGKDPSVLLADLVGDEEDYEEFWQRARTNLQAGRIRLLFVADRIPAELRRIVEFLNGQMERAEVLAVEIRQYIGEGRRALVPRVLGHTATAENVKHPSRRTRRLWDEGSFMEELLAKEGKEASGVAMNIIKWSQSEIAIPRWGSGATMGSFSASIAHGGFRHVLFDVWTTGNLGIRFQRLKKIGPFADVAARSELVNRFNEIPGVNIESPEGWPEFRLELLSSKSSLEKFVEIILYMKTEIQDYKPDSECDV